MTLQDNLTVQNRLNPMEGKIKISRKERRIYLLYLSLLTIASGAALVWLLFRKYPSPFAYDSESSRELLYKRKIFLDRQGEILKQIDTAFARIEMLQPEKNNVFIETDIKNLLNDINSYYDGDPKKDPRFICFHQAAVVFKNFFEDRLIVAKTNDDIKLFSEQLDNCSIGYKDKENLLNQRKIMERARKDSN